MVVCRYFQQGCCKFGDNCRFEHPGSSAKYGGDDQYGHQRQSPRNYYDSGYGKGKNTYSQYDNRANPKHDNRGNYNHYNNDYNDGYGGSQFDSGQWRGGGSGSIDSRGQYDNSGRYNSRGKYDSRYSYQGNQSRQDGIQSQISSQRADHQLTNADYMKYITEDMEMWEGGNMWLFSCYGCDKEWKSFPGLEDISFEEIRLSAYEANSSGNSATYLAWISQLEKDYKTKQTELRQPNALAKTELVNMIEHLKQLKSQNTTSSSTFPSAGTTFPTSSLVTNSFSGSGILGASPQSAFQPSGFAFTTSTPVPGAAQSNVGNFFGSVQASPQVLFGASGAGCAPPSSFGASSSLLFNSAAFSNSPASDTPFIPQQLAPTATVVPQQQFQTSSNQEDLLYMPMDQLTPEEKSAFESDKFTLGCVPIRTPPKELV